MKLMKIQFYILLFLFLLACDDEGVSPVYGCMDEKASNYLEDANIDDDSCEYCFEDPVGIINGNDDCYEVDDDFSGVGFDDDCDECGVCDNEYTYTYDDDIRDLFNTESCLGCHSGSSSGGLKLSTYQGVLDGSTNSGSIINDCNFFPENSVLITTLLPGGTMCDSYNQCADSSFEEKLMVWISEGAPE